MSQIKFFFHLCKINEIGPIFLFYKWLFTHRVLAKSVHNFRFGYNSVQLEKSVFCRWSIFETYWATFLHRFEKSITSTFSFSCTQLYSDLQLCTFLTQHPIGTSRLKYKVFPAYPKIPRIGSSLAKTFRMKFLKLRNARNYKACVRDGWSRSETILYVK